MIVLYAEKKKTEQRFILYIGLSTELKQVELNLLQNYSNNRIWMQSILMSVGDFVSLVYNMMNEYEDLAWT